MGGKKKKGGGKKKDDAEDEEETPKPQFLPGSLDSFVVLEFKLLNWKYMNFSLKLRDSTHIFTIKKILRERHGRIDDLRLCFHSFTESNEVHNEMLTLREYKIIGEKPEVVIDANGNASLDESKFPVIPVFYDFKPSDFSDPVLLYSK